MLTYGDLVRNEINSAGDLDLCRFAGMAGDFASIAVTETGDDSRFRHKVEIFDPQGRSVVEASGLSRYYFHSPMVTVATTLVEDGRYTITVQELGDGTSPYTLVLMNWASGTGTAISYGDSVTEQLEPRGDVDGYVFAGVAGDVVLLTITSIDDEFPSRPQVRVFNPSGISIVKAEVAIGSSSKTVTFNLATSGLHTITVMGATFQGGGSLAGSYALSLEKLAGN